METLRNYFIGGEELEKSQSIIRIITNSTVIDIINLIGHGEKSVRDIEIHLRKSQSFVSQHLGKLRMIGAVTTRRQGKKIYYSVDSMKLDEITGHLSNLAEAI